MRRTLFSALCFLLFTSAQAQTEKGRWLVGATGTASFDLNDDAFKQTIVLLSPAAGYFVANNVAIGAAAPLVYARSKSSGDFLSQAASFGLSPFVRAYLGKSATVKPYLHGQVGVTGTSSKSSGFGRDGSESSSSFLYGGAAGLAFFLNEHSSFDVNLAYTGGSSQGNNSGLLLAGTYPKTLTLNVGFQLFLGKAK